MRDLKLKPKPSCPKCGSEGVYCVRTMDGWQMRCTKNNHKGEMFATHLEAQKGWTNANSS